jgi:hypothetical protein
MLTSFQTCFASVAPTLGDATACGVLWQAAPGRFLLDVPDVARYLVSDGAVITIDRAPAARDQDVTHFLNMTPLAALLFQRGQLALHAAAVSPPSPRQGEEGRGDEVGAMRLWQDAREKLGFDQSSIVLTAFEVSAPQPLRAIHWLSIHYKDDVELDELAGAERFRAIGLLTYNSHIADALFDRAVYLRCATAVAQMAPMYRLRRPRGRWSVADLADRVVLTR